MPQVLRHFILWDLASDEEDASIEECAPNPLVKSLIASTTLSIFIGFKIFSAPKDFALSNLCWLVSSAITFTPMLEAIITADNPTGPKPKTANVSWDLKHNLSIAPQAVPVPHEIAAPLLNEISSRNFTRVSAGHFIYLAWAPWPVTP